MYRELWEELVTMLKSKYFLWLLLIPVSYMIYIPLWGYGLFEYYICLNPNPFYYLLSNIVYPIIFYSLYFIWVLWIDKEEKMHDAFYRTVVVIIIGMFLWVLLSFQTAM